MGSDAEPTLMSFSAHCEILLVIGWLMPGLGNIFNFESRRKCRSHHEPRYRHRQLFPWWSLDFDIDHDCRRVVGHYQVSGTKALERMAQRRHPQYTGIYLVLFGQLIHWPTLPTLLLFPPIVYIYYHLAKKEEKAMLENFGRQYEIYVQQVPMFFPKIANWGKVLSGGAKAA